jgi:AcrR family transcriptional regulator
MDGIDLDGLDLPEKEKRILQAAIGIFSEKGYSASTTSEIAKNAGVAEGTIFRYYKTKKDILRSILIQLINLVSSKVVISGIDKIFEASEGKDLKAILKEVIYDRMKLADSVMPMFRVIATEAIYHEDVRNALYENIIKRVLELFGAFYAKLAERGMIRNDVPPLAVFRSLLGGIALLIAQKMLFGSHLSIKDLDAEVDTAIDILLNGLIPREPPAAAEP